MHRSIFTTALPFIHGFCRVSEPTAYLADSVIFELFVCFILFWIVKSVLVIKLTKRQKSLEEAEKLYEEIVEEMDDPEQTKYLERCLEIAESAVKEYDGLIFTVNHLSHMPTHKICRQILPQGPVEPRHVSQDSLPFLNDLVPPSVRLAPSDLLLEPEDSRNAEKIDLEIRLVRSALDSKKPD